VKAYFSFSFLAKSSKRKGRRSKSPEKTASDYPSIPVAREDVRESK
jgi:hypothetical protein